ncbi:MAG: M56 family metallopeptidase [Acidobacteria bacterium]|nr:M56 family metallopeptidase [Acidobacteriota bacterium]
MPQLCWCDDLDGPALLGFSNPIVAMPRAHGARLTDQELKHVLLHELAHVRRRDDWAACVELVLAGVLWTNPVVHVLRRSLGLAREMACDDWVVQHTAAPVAYARCLTTVAELRRRSRPARLASAATGSRSVLGRRVVRVLARDPRPSVRVSRAVAALTPVAVGCLAIMLIQTPPFVVDGRPATLALTSIAPQAAPEAAAGTNSGDLQSTVPNRPRIGIQLSTRIPVPDRQPTNAVDSPPVTGGGVDARGGSPTGDAALLSASPLPGTSVPGVIAIDGTVASDSIGPDVRTPWWGRAASVGAATGGGATSAGRVTASFFKRLGASVAKPLTR